LSLNCEATGIVTLCRPGAGVLPLSTSPPLPSSRLQGLWAHQELCCCAREADRGSSGEILQPLVTFIGPYSLHLPTPQCATVGLPDLHCEDQEQPDHAYQIANLAHAHVTSEHLPGGEREIFTP
jgi:hypothetical protein